MAELYGIQPSYELAGGQIEVSDEAMSRILTAARFNEHAPEYHRPRIRNPYQPEGMAVYRFEVECTSDLMEETIQVELGLEEGARIRPDGLKIHGRMAMVEFHELPVGYHKLNINVRELAHELLIMVHPRRAPGITGERLWGLFLPIHALWSEGFPGVGDFGDLRRLMEWTGELGGSVVATLPFLAAFLDKPCEPSPYSPVSRLFWNEFFIDTAAIPGMVELEGDVEPSSCEFVNYFESMKVKRVVLERCAKTFYDSGQDASPAFQEFLRGKPELEQYAAFRAVHEARGGEDWRLWPEELRGGELDPMSVPQESFRYHLYVQWLAERQLEDLRGASGGERTLYLDLPLGVHAGGYDTWRYQELFIDEVSLGAPPDLFFTAGQNWGLAPIDPHKLEASHFKYFIEVIRHHCRQSGTLRLDHIMGLHRMFWIPQGAHAKDGGYVRYPAEALYAILLIEASRTGTRLVGEDLGTVPPDCRHMMHERGIHRMHVVQFGLDPWRDDPVLHPPHEAVVSLNTHDLPPWKSFIEGLDLDEAQEMGLLSQGDAENGKRDRWMIREKLTELLRREGRLPADFGELGDREKDLSLLRGLLVRLAEGDSPLMIISLEDLWLETERQNLPGTGAEKPNWRHRSRRSMDEFMADPSIRGLLGVVSEARKRAC